MTELSYRELNDIARLRRFTVYCDNHVIPSSPHRPINSHYLVGHEWHVPCIKDLA